MCRSWPIPRRIDSAMPGISSRAEMCSLFFSFLFHAIVYDCRHGPTTCTVLCY